jgi:hypothetical protein
VEFSDKILLGNEKTNESSKETSYGLQLAALYATPFTAVGDSCYLY